MSGCGFSSPLRAAIRNNDIQSARAILEEAGSASPQLINEDTSSNCLLDWIDCSRKPTSPIFYPVAKRDLEMTSLLIAHGADLTLAGPNGETVLHTAAGFNSIELCKLIHANMTTLLYVEDHSGRLAIHWACTSILSAQQGDTRVLQWMLELDPSLVAKQDCNGVYPHDIAKAKHNTAATDLLKSYNR